MDVPSGDQPGAEVYFMCEMRSMVMLPRAVSAAAGIARDRTTPACMAKRVEPLMAAWYTRGLARRTALDLDSIQQLQRCAFRGVSSPENQKARPVSRIG